MEQSSRQCLENLVFHSLHSTLLKLHKNIFDQINVSSLGLLIEYYDTIVNGYNILKGGKGSSDPLCKTNIYLEGIRKRNEIKKLLGIKQFPEHTEKVRKAITGKIRTKEQRKKLSEVKKKENNEDRQLHLAVVEFFDFIIKKKLTELHGRDVIVNVYSFSKVLDHKAFHI